MSESPLRPHHQAARELSELCAHFGLESDADLDQIEVTGVASHADATRAGDLFVVIHSDAEPAMLEAVATAVDQGAIAVIASPNASLADHVDVPVLVVDEPLLALGPISSWVYRTEQRLGRLLTTLGGEQRRDVARCVDMVLELLGEPRALLVQGQAYISDEDEAAITTPPRADDLHAMLARMRELQINTVALELSSSEILEHLIDGTDVDVVAYCGGLAGQPDAEQVLAEVLNPDHSRRAVVLMNDALATRAIEESRVPVTTVGLGVTPADWQARIDEGGRFTLRGRDERTVSTVVQAADLESARTVLALALVMLEEAGWALEQLQEAFDRNDGIDLTPVFAQSHVVAATASSDDSVEALEKGTSA